MKSKELRQVIEDWYVLKTYGEVYENLHRDNQADIKHYFDVTGDYGQVLSNNDWAALCKEWARENGYIISSIPTKIHWRAVVDNKELFISNTEPEVVFRACQWILDNRNELKSKED